jgi:hypothetical protein
MIPSMRHGRKRKARGKAGKYRERMRALGLRRVEIWVPDTRTAAFRAEAHRQSLVVAQNPGERADQAFVDALAEEAFTEWNSPEDEEAFRAL